MPMKVLHFLISGGMGGAEMFFIRLGRALHGRGMPQHMVLTPNAQREAYLAEHGVPHTVIDFDRGLKIGAHLALYRTLHREKPDVVVAWMDRAGRNLPHGRFRTVGRIGNFYALDNYRRCEFIVANSPELVAHAQAHGREAAMIPNFVELAEGPAAALDRPKRPLLFAAGRLHPNKGFDVLIRALPGLDAHLWIAGTGGDELPNLQRLAGELGVSDRVEFLGWRSDIAALLRTADIFVLPSRIEGTSNAILEAMAAARPIVTTTGPSVSWFLKDGENARLVPPDDAEALRMALGGFIGDPAVAERMGVAARAAYDQQFGEEAIVKAWENWLHTLAS
jgi:glycosyltransferase involved in cell wall biosynthesis